MWVQVHWLNYNMLLSQDRERGTKLKANIFSNISPNWSLVLVTSQYHPYMTLGSVCWQVMFASHTRNVYWHLVSCYWNTRVPDYFCKNFVVVTKAVKVYTNYIYMAIGGFLKPSILGWCCQQFAKLLSIIRKYLITVIIAITR